MQKANISVLFDAGAISKEYYEYLYVADRMTRQIEIGYLLRNDSSLSNVLSDGIMNFRRKLFESNNLSESDVVAIKNDAVFVMKNRLKILEFGIVKFVEKNKYSTFIKIGKLEIFFRSNIVDGTSDIDVKGISDKTLEKHKNGILPIIATLLMYLESGDIQSAVDYISDMYLLYINRKLSIDCYRQFDSDSLYYIKTGYSTYSADRIGYMTSGLDISYNLNIMRQLYGLAVNIYFNKYNRR